MSATEYINQFKTDRIARSLDLVGLDGSHYTCDITISADEKIKRAMKRHRYGYERAFERMLRETRCRSLAAYRGFKVAKTTAVETNAA